MRLVTANRIRYLPDNRAGFPMRRTRSWLMDTQFEDIVGSFCPDVLITQLLGAGDFADVAIKRGVRPVVLLRDMDDVPFDDRQAKDRRITFVSNSKAVQRWALDTYAIDSSIIYPPIDLTVFRRAATPKYVTFINPTAPKGVDLAIEIARASPDILFLFVESWPLDPVEYSDLAGRLSSVPNVTLWRRRTNVQEVYDVTRLLIVPSRWEEAFGRVVVEAQACGIPVVARDVGGLSEAVGLGGKVLAGTATAQDWASEIEALMHCNDGLYGRLQSAALENARCGEWNAEKAVDRLERLLIGLGPSTHVA